MANDNNQTLICRHLLLSSPPGQFDLILGDISNIVSHSTSQNQLSPEFIENTRSEYKENNNLTPAQDASSSSNSNDLRSCIQSSLKSYMESTYAKTSTKGVLCSFSCEPSSSDVLLLKTHVEKINLKNFHAGSWTATYSYNIEEKTLGGEANIHAHYFENGNVQLQSHRSFDPVKVKEDGHDLMNVSNHIISKLKQWENGIMGDLSDMFTNMNDSKLKSMRRVLPVSRVKMDWNLRTHRMAKTLNDSKQTFQ